MDTFQIPLTNVPQSFEITLGGRLFVMTCKWNNSPDAGWFIDLQDGVTNEMLIAGLPLVTGVNLLEPFEYLAIEGRLVIYTDGDEFAVPMLDNLGAESNLYYQVEAS